MDEKEKGQSIEKRIRITDSVMNEQINRIMTLPGYRKSCNRVINEALFYGLPILCEKLFGEVTLSDETAPPSERKIARLEDKHFQTMIRLLKETVLNVTINKSILSSVFHDLKGINKALNVDTEQYEQGLMSDTPDYLYEYEMSGLKKMRR